MMPARSKLVVCETPAAILLHLREVGDAGINYSGHGENATTLCGAMVGWDTMDELVASNCYKCLTILADCKVDTAAAAALAAREKADRAAKAAREKAKRAGWSDDGG